VKRRLTNDRSPPQDGVAYLCAMPSRSTPERLCLSTAPLVPARARPSHGRRKRHSARA
jgi:hypothetical protein